MNDRRRGMMGETGSAPLVHGTWADLFHSIDAGTYSSDYALGEEITLDLGSGVTINMQIVAFDADTLSNSADKAPVTLISKTLYTSTKRFNPAYSAGTNGTGTIGGWEYSELRSYVSTTVKSRIPQNVLNRIVAVKKYSKGYDTSDAVVTNGLTTDEVWVPSMRELNITSGYETSGPAYSSIFPNKTARIKYYNSTATGYNSRSAYSTSKVIGISATGTSTSGNAQTAARFCFGFCVG